MPGDAGGHAHRAFEFLGMFGFGKFPQIGARRADERVQHQHDAALVFARKFADHHVPCARGDFPVHETRAIGRQIIAQRMQFVAATAKNAGHFAAEQRQHFVELVGRLDARVDDDFQLRSDRTRLFEEAKREAGANSKSVLAVRSAARKNQLNFLARGTQTRNVRKKYRPGENLASGVLFGLSNHAQGKRWPEFLIVAQFHLRHDRLLGEHMFGHVELQPNTGKHGAGEHAGNNDAGQRTGQDHEKQIVAGVDRSKNQNADDAEVNHALAGQFVINLIDHPAKTGAPGKIRNDGDRDPTGKSQRYGGRSCGESDAPLLGDGRRE